MSRRKKNAQLGCLLTGPIPDPRKGKGGNTGEVGYHELQKQQRSETESTLSPFWFNKIDISPDHQKLLAYPESCLIIDSKGESIGKMYTSVDVSSWAAKPCLLVHSGSYAKIQADVHVGTSLTGFLTPDLHVIQELCHEWAIFKSNRFDRTTFLMKEEDSDVESLYYRSTFKRDEKIKYDRTGAIPFLQLRNFVSESANIMLLRLIMLEKMTGKLELVGLGPKCTTIPIEYEVLGRGLEMIKDEKVEVYGVRRSLLDEDTGKVESAWDSMFNFYGRLMLRCQPKNNDHAMIPLWFRPIDEYNDFGQNIGAVLLAKSAPNLPEETVLQEIFQQVTMEGSAMRAKPPLIWACDQELYSNYLVKKTELAAQYKTYLCDHPALRAVLSDFMQRVLFIKPLNIVHFANEYFTPLLNLRPESPETSECDTSSSSGTTCDEVEETEDEYHQYEGEDNEALFQNILDLHKKIFASHPGEVQDSGEAGEEYSHTDGVVPGFSTPTDEQLYGESGEYPILL